MASEEVTGRNYFNFWADLSLGPKTLAEITKQGDEVPPRVPNWQTLQFGITVGNEKTKLDIGIRTGFSLDEKHNEAGILLSPHHAGHPALRTEWGLLFTEFDRKLEEGRLTPYVGWNLSLPKLPFYRGNGSTDFSIQPYINMGLLLGWDADPVSFLKDIEAGNLLPSPVRAGGGIRFRFGERATLEDRWDQGRVAAVLTEELALLYPSVATAFSMGAIQSVFVDIPYPEFQYLKQHQFPVELKPFLTDSQRHETWKREFEYFERADKEGIDKTLKLAGDVNTYLGAFQGIINGQMMSLDASLFHAARRGEISNSIPLGVVLTKGGMGALLLGLSLFKEGHPGNIPPFGNHSPEEIEALIANPDPVKIRRIAGDFENAGNRYLERVEDWGNDYRWRGAEYLGHSLLLQASVNALYFYSDISKSRWGEEFLTWNAVLAGTALLATQTAYVHLKPAGSFESIWKSDFSSGEENESARDYYKRAKISSHLTLAGSTLLTYGLMTWLHSKGWNTF